MCTHVCTCACARSDMIHVYHVQVMYVCVCAVPRIYEYSVWVAGPGESGGGPMAW